MSGLFHYFPDDLLTIFVLDVQPYEVYVGNSCAFYPRAFPLIKHFLS